MINFYRKSALAASPWQKTIKIMKLVTVLLLTGIMQIHAAAYSQNVYNFSVNNVSVKQMFKQIEKSSKYTVFYRLDQVDVDKKINVEAQDAPIETVMKLVLQKQPLTFQVVDDIIIIKPADDKPIVTLTVTGVVKDIGGQPLPGVSVKLRGSNLGTVTNVDGKYTLTMPDGNGTLEFGFLGFTTQVVTVNGKNIINVTLLEEAKGLNEVVVVGYASQKKKDLIGAVSVVDVQALNKQASGSINSQLQGQASGVTVIGSGQPGAEPQVRIRGFNSFGNNNPLYVVDGIPTQDISTINPNDIESFQILKDASSASIYGARASNGVIIITTKKGKGKVAIQYDAYYGRQVPKGGNVWHTLNPQETANLKHLAQENSGVTDFQDDQYNPDGTGTTYTLPDYISPAGAKFGDPAADPSKYYINPFYTSPDDYNSFYRITEANKAGTDWYHEIFKTAPMTSHNLSVSSGGEQGSYLFSLNYFNQQGTLINTYEKRYTIRANSQHNFSKHIRIGENLAYSVVDNPQVGFNNGDAVIAHAFREQPIIPVYDIKGNYAGDNGPGLGDSFNPVAIQQRTANNKSLAYRLFGNVFAEADFLHDFTIRTSFGGETASGASHSFTYPTYENVENSQINQYNEDSYSNYNWTWTNTLAYHKTIKKHDIKVLVGSEANQNHDSNLGGARQGYFSFDPNYTDLSTGDVGSASNYSYRGESSLFSLFARADYIFDDKYLFNATIRRDGASNFSAVHQYGWFPAFSAGWRVSQESFMKGATWLNDLKIRGGYGIMGNQLNVTSSNRFDAFSTAVGQSYYAINGGNTVVAGFYQSQIGNQDAKWEKDANTNIGFDASLFNSAITITADYYRKDIRDLLYNPEVLGTVGNGTVPFVNIAKMKTEGIDATIAANFKVNKVGFNASFNLTTFSNKITKVSNDANYFDIDNTRGFDVGFVRNQVGHSYGEFYGYKIAGFWNTQQEVDAANAKVQQATNDPNATYQTDIAVGRFKYVDVNGDGKITDADRTFIGNPNPKFSTGLNLGVNYAGFDFNVLLYGVFGNKIWNNVKRWRDFYSSFITAKSQTALYDSWTPTHMNAKAPIQELNSSFSSNTQPNSYFVENGSYVRARNAQLGYTFSPNGLKKLGIQKLRVYVSGTNLFTISGYSGIDPELQGQADGQGRTTFGIDEGTYASPRTFLLGVNLTL
jgi:TonB-linked SusC/RagA family outer membrane protein